MAAFLVLTPPGAAARPEDARFLPDGFSAPAFLLPAVWLLAHRAYAAAALALSLQVLGLALLGSPAFSMLGLAILTATGLLAGLEGPALVAAGLEGKGWTLDAVVAADLEEAEAFYYAQAAGTPLPATAMFPTAENAGPRHQPMIGLVGFGEGR